MFALNLILIYCLGLETVWSFDYSEDDYDTFDNDQPFYYNSPHNRRLNTYSKTKINSSFVGSGIFVPLNPQKPVTAKIDHKWTYDSSPHDNHDKRADSRKDSKKSGKSKNTPNLSNFNRRNNIRDDEQDYFQPRKYHRYPYRSPRIRRRRRHPRHRHKNRGRHRVTNYGLKFSTKTDYKVSGSGDANADLLGNKVGAKGAVVEEGNMKLEGDNTLIEASGASKGEGKAAVISDTVAGTVVGKGGTGHDWSGKAAF